jgi:hypothetical protein
MSGLEVIGATAAILQLVQQICSVCNHLMEKRKDAEAIRRIAASANRYIDDLRRWEAILVSDSADACRCLREQLEGITADIAKIQARKKWTRIIKYFTLENDEFWDRFASAVGNFQLNMCIEGQKSVYAMDHRLEKLAKKMEELRITAKTMKSLGIQDGIATVHVQLGTVSMEIQEMKDTIAMDKAALQRMDESVSKIREAVIADGALTREQLRLGSTTIMARLDDIVENAHINIGAAMIQSEILPMEEVIRYDESGERPFRVWSLSSHQTSLPVARYNGTDLSAKTLSNTYDDMITKRHITYDVERSIRERKRSNIADPSPYVGLAKRGNHVEILEEYIPDLTRENLMKLSTDDRILALRTIRTLSHEFSSLIASLVLESDKLTFPNLHLLEDMERAMLLLHFGQIEIRAGFYQGIKVGPNEYYIDFTLHISRCVN